MARQIDITKMERVKQSAIELIVSEGYGGASIAKIARGASVAEGYLYRFYSSKTELVSGILQESMNMIISSIEESVNSNTPVNEILAKSISMLFELAKSDMARMKFIYVLINDYNFSVDDKLRSRIVEISGQICEKGKNSGMLKDNIEAEDIYLVTVLMPIQLINSRFKGTFGKNELDQYSLEKTIKFCIDALLR